MWSAHQPGKRCTSPEDCPGGPCLAWPRWAAAQQESPHSAAACLWSYERHTPPTETTMVQWLPETHSRKAKGALSCCVLMVPLLWGVELLQGYGKSVYECQFPLGWVDADTLKLLIQRFHLATAQSSRKGSVLWVTYVIEKQYLQSGLFQSCCNTDCYQKPFLPTAISTSALWRKLDHEMQQHLIFFCDH